MKTPNILVIGSVNMDLVARVERMPRPGETVRGSDFQTIPGGKGANQAVAAARLGANTFMAGRLGDDGFGAMLRESLRRDGVNDEAVLETPDCPSGIALIGVEDSGENAITIIAGANDRVTPDDVTEWEPLIERADAVVLQLEIPLETAEAAIACAKSHDVMTVLDPAPAHDQLPDAFYTVDVISPNQTEAERLTGAEGEAAAHVLRDWGVATVVMKLGEQGALFLDENDHAVRVPAFPVDPVDTTAAGDAFTAALTTALAQGQSLEEAVRFGCAAGALAATRPGAQPGMPDLNDVLELLENQPGRITP